MVTKTPKFIPNTTYRIQLNKDFGFKDLSKILPYLKRLGIDTIYTSPFLKAVPGSMHGYNIIDPHHINPEIGSEEDFEKYLTALKANGLEQIIDIVPNHMGVLGGENPWWLDVLENGPKSNYANYFDIDWNPYNKNLKNKILLPILGKYYGRVIDNKEIQLSLTQAGFQASYFTHKFPLALHSYSIILNYKSEKLSKNINQEDFTEYQNLINSFKKINKKKQKEKISTKEQLQKLIQKNSAIETFITENLNEINGEIGKARSFDLLNKILDEQFYRLCYWKVATEEINYRRFFDINELAAIRIEAKDVFENYHKFVFDLIESGQAKALRIDHPDGLYYPEKYFADLQKNFSEPIYVAIEKILEPNERLNQKWAVNGTVGYDFLNSLNGIFIQSNNKEAFDNLYENFLGYEMDFDKLLYQKKKSFALQNMAAELNSLGHKLDSISELSRYYRDFTRNNLTLALGEIIACFPVYRSYISPTDKEVSKKDQEYIKAAVTKAKHNAKDLNSEIFDFLEKVLLLELKDILRKEEKLYRDFILRFQQLSGPVMAKGLEDTSMYVYNKLVSLNEVGGDPNCFGISIEDFHKQNITRHKYWPYSMLASSTHDTKRSEDVRARINVLSEIPQTWKEKVTFWSEINRKHKTSISNILEPRWNTEYFIYQTLIGVWTDGNNQEIRSRIWQYIQKAIREAKLYTNWLNPNIEYENAVEKFLQGILADQEFLDNFLEFQEKISQYGKLNSISALVIKTTSPGVIDTYQGNESWDYSLVDPDNRRPVDYELRMKFFKELATEIENNFLSERIQEQNLKFFISACSLSFRNQNKKLLLEGNYVPLKIEGKRENNLIAFMRKLNDEISITIAGRFFTELQPKLDNILDCKIDWQDTVVTLPQMQNITLKDIFTGNKFELKENSWLEPEKLFTKLNVAILKIESN